MIKKILFLLTTVFLLSLGARVSLAKVDLQIPSTSHLVINPIERNFRFLIRAKNTSSQKSTIVFSGGGGISQTQDWINIFPAGAILLDPGEEAEIIATFEPVSQTPKAQDETKYDFKLSIDGQEQTIPLTITSKAVDPKTLEKAPVNVLVLDKKTQQKIEGASYILTLPSGMERFGGQIDYSFNTPISGTKTSIINQYYTQNNVSLSFTNYFLTIKKTGYKTVYLTNVQTEAASQTVYLEPQTEFFDFEKIAEKKTEFSIWWIKASVNHKFFAFSAGAHPNPDIKPPSEVGIYLFNNKGEQLWRYPVPVTNYVGTDVCWGLDISPNGQYVAAGCYDGSVYLINQKGELVKKFKAGSMVRSVAFSPNSKYLAFGPAENTDDIALIDVATTNLVWSKKVGDWVRSLAFSADGQLLSVSSSNGMLNLFDLSGNKKWQKSNGGLVSFLNNFSGDGKMLVTGGKGREIIAYNPLNGEKIWDKVIDQTAVAGPNNTASDGRLAFGTVGGSLWYFDTNGEPRWRYEYGGFGHNGLHLTKNGDYVLAGGSNPTLFDQNGVILWQLDPNEKNRMYSASEQIGGANVVWLSDDASQMILGKDDGTIIFLSGKKVQRDSLVNQNENAKSSLSDVSKLPKWAIILLISLTLILSTSIITAIIFRIRRISLKDFMAKTFRNLGSKTKRTLE